MTDDKDITRRTATDKLVFRTAEITGYSGYDVKTILAGMKAAMYQLVLEDGYSTNGMIYLSLGVPEEPSQKDYPYLTIKASSRYAELFKAVKLSNYHQQLYDTYMEKVAEAYDKVNNGNISKNTN